ncbi:hypothetical protein [Pelagibius sp. Alg239-R121]|uniref:hypothetical protein n=1 Tax=Pelagibius sp. Alg239-R121 TaxID=2993448 RepID=UPI0024A7482C|nr:hypothetical protein [Pelagibius sp. Alg239-R121]
MSNDHLTLTVPDECQNNRAATTNFGHVGAVFENSRRDTGETFLNANPEIPVGATELVVSQPKADGEAYE